jgi:hypothetical protein
VRTITTGPPAYLAALDELAASLRDAQELAGRLDYFAGQLRGQRPDPEGPPLEACPSTAEVRRALARVDRARSRAEVEWDRLPAEAREAARPPRELLDDGLLG